MSEWIEFSGKTVEDALTDALINLQTTSDKVEYDVIERENAGILGLFAKKDAKIKVRIKCDIKDTAEEFLSKVFTAMNVNAKVNIEYNVEDKFMDIDLVGEDTGILIGKRGQTLDSLQYLVSLVVNKDHKEYIKVKVDTENYRQRRKETLENLARNIAHKVKKTRRSVTLEPMNPYERRVIHSTLQDDKYVDTHSEGDEPYRKVVVTLKKGYEGGGYRNNNYKGGRGRYNNKYNRRQSYNNNAAAEESGAEE